MLSAAGLEISESLDKSDLLMLGTEHDRLRRFLDMGRRFGIELNTFLDT